MEIKYELLTMATLVNRTNYPLQNGVIKKTSKQRITLENGLIFSKKGWLLNTKQNKEIIGKILRELGFNTIFAFHAKIKNEFLVDI